MVTGNSVTTGAKKANRVTKPEVVILLKLCVEAGRGLWEFRTAEVKNTL